MAELSGLEREVLLWWAHTACWRRHDELVRALVAREVPVEEIASAREVPVPMILEILTPPQDGLRRGRRKR